MFIFTSKDKLWNVVWTGGFRQQYEIYYKRKLFAKKYRFKDCENFLGKGYKTKRY
jgi:hypothetical protein